MKPLAGLVLTTTFALAAAGSPPAGVVGDANGDGVFSSLDVSYAKTALRLRSTRPNPLADVARPCNGLLEPADGQRLLAASLAAKDGISVRSRCHHEAIGEAIQAPPAPKPLVTIDSLFLDISGRVPEFGGLFVEAGEPRVVLTNTAVLSSAWAEIERVFGRGRFDSSRVAAVPARYTFSELASWKEEAEALLGQGAVTLVDADERRNVLRLGLLDLRQQGDIERELQRTGVPLAAVVFEARRPAELGFGALATALRQRQRPLVGGLLIETAETVCTLGFLAKRFGMRGFITNSHCIWPMGEETGKEVFQSGSDPLSDRVGFEFVDPPWTSSGSRLSDAAFVALEHDETGLLGRLAQALRPPGPGSPFWFNEVVGEGVAVCGEEVGYVGASSGQVAGEVIATCISRGADSAVVPGAPEVATYTCQTVVAATSVSGDSGAAVFRRLGVSNQVELLGIQWGGADGHSSYSPLANIETNVGPLEVTVADELPEIEITAPPDGSSLGPGAFPVAELTAEVFDFEWGGDCSSCQVRWMSAKDGGELGVTPWNDGESSLSAVLGGGPGWRAITATATDAASQTAWDTIVLSSGNGPPSVWIDWPASGTTLYRNVPYQLQGSSFDAESFQALPCADLTWTATGPSASSFPKTGCSPAVTFSSLGAHTLKLDGVDERSLHGLAAVTVQVVNAPASAPPVVTFTTPAPGAAIPFATFTTVTATVTNPASGGLLTYEWFLTPGAGPSVFMGSGWVTSGGQVSISVRPSDIVAGGCGSTSLRVYLYATNLSVITGNAVLSLETIQPPC